MEHAGNEFESAAWKSDALTIRPTHTFINA